MKYEQRKKAQPYAETVKHRFPNAPAKFIEHLIAIQRGEVRP